MILPTTLSAGLSPNMKTEPFSGKYREVSVHSNLGNRREATESDLQ